MFRTRFAPSPTGYVHIGNLRTALFEYLAAKANKGTFILRVEDTDQERYIEGALENLLKILNWIGINHDEGPMLDNDEKGNFGPYVQSERKELHLAHAKKLIKTGDAYYCFCTKERLDDLREIQKRAGKPPMYDRKCAFLSKEQIEENLKNGIPYVIRQKIPYETLKFQDLIHGNIQFDGKTIDDQILIKSDGLPTYHLANVVDDHSMEITHVIRGDEWLPSTPKHLFLYRAFSWEPPQFAHLPLILNPDKTKLSKRQGDVTVEDYIKKGFCKEAIINFIALLGWNPGKGSRQEIFSLKELEENFSIEKIHKSGAIFDLEKLKWFNFQWKKRLFSEELISLAKNIDPEVGIFEDQKKSLQFSFGTEASQTEFLKIRGEKLLSKISEQLPVELIKNEKEKLLRALITVEEKIHKDPTQTHENIRFYFEMPSYKTSLLSNEKMKVDLAIAKTALKTSLESLEKTTLWTENNIKDTLISTVEKLELKNGQVFWPLRVALSGLEFSPGVFEILWVLGKDESLKRITDTLSKL